MIGRTNVPQRKVPVINGDLNSYTVGSGNTIHKGDFVSFNTINPMSTSSRSIGTVYDYKIFDEQSGLMVISGVENDTLRLYLISPKDNFFVHDSYDVGTYNSYTSAQNWGLKQSHVCYFCITSNNKVVCVVNSTFYCFSVNTTTKKFTLEFEQTIETPSTFYSQTYRLGLTGICEVESGKFVCSGMGQIRSSTLEGYFGFIEFDFDETLTFHHTTTYIQYYASNVQPIHSYDGKLFCVLGKYLASHSVDFQNYTVTNNYTFALPSSSSTERVADFGASFRNNYIAFDTSNGREFVCRFDASAVAVIWNSSSNFAKPVFLNDDDVMLFHISNNLYYVSVLEDISGGATVSNSVTGAINRTNNKAGFGIRQGSKIYYGIGYDWIYNFEYGELATPESTTEVISYNGSKAIGFSTNDGNAGATIQVYVPHTSS